jgi:hypothetical protein
LENLGVKLVRQAGAKTNDIAGDGCTTSIILAQGLIAEGMKVCLCMNSLRVPHTGLWFYIILFVSSVYRKFYLCYEH